MAFVRYQSPDDPAFLVFDASRFRVDHAIFLLSADPLRALIAERLAERPDEGQGAIGLRVESRRLGSCLEWLESLDDGPETVAIPGLEHEAALDLVADRLIAEGAFERAFCLACEAEYARDRVERESWRFEEGGVTIEGRRSVCPRGHTIHALCDGIDVPGLEDPGD